MEPGGKIHVRTENQRAQVIWGVLIFFFFLNKHQPPQPWHVMPGTPPGEVPDGGRALELSTHTLA